METIYIVIVAVLFLLAISDLVVGVSNDAVNFLNSAIGSKVAPFKVIMIIASLGIIVGATFSSGMMEVARKGIFHPQYFHFSEIMYIFLAVMITDVILLDTFNTYGMPTSTTVSIVFELLGAAVGIAIIKGYTDPNALELSEYINSAKALAIISGILLSVVIAFTVGAIIQFITRIVFSFNYKKTIKRYGAIWGGIAITAITYFILIKGAKGASFMSGDLKKIILENTINIILISFAAWTVVLQLLSWFTKLNILKLIVLVGTFALAMAFAGNDLVNFIGVPLAGYESFKAWMASGGPDPNAFLMADLTGKVKTPTMFLLVAGLVMVITLWFSKKAKSVTKTEINLARQDAGFERFGSSGFARSLVRATNKMTSGVNSFLPSSVISSIEKRFDRTQVEKIEEDEEAASFDLIRASVNLVVASILISFATSLKLPLSTTYVTFMVAMGTSLSDKAWGRESAVYRITGVFSVIGGWFLTAFSAFTIAFLVGFALYYGGIVAVAILLAIAIFLVFRTHAIHKKVAEKLDESESLEASKFSDTNIIAKSSDTITHNINAVIKEYGNIISALENEDYKELKKVGKNIDNLTSKTKYLKNNLNVVIDKLKEDSEETAYYFVEVLDYMREMLHSISFINGPSYDHVNNNHKPLLKVQVDELNQLYGFIKEILEEIINVINKSEYSKIDNIVGKEVEFVKFSGRITKNQIRRVKAGESGTRTSFLYLTIVNESKNLVLQAVNLLKSQRDFVNYKKKL